MLSKSNLSFRLLTITFVFLCTIIMSKPLKADMIIPNYGWKIFNFGVTGSNWDKMFSFDLITPGVLTVTDAFLAGDIFEVFNFNTSLGFTSTPTTVISKYVTIWSDYEAAASQPKWSTGVWNLDAGSYVISGIATQSPFNAGSAALRVDTAFVPEPSNMLVNMAPVPEPSTILLLGAALTGLAALGRKRRS